MNVAPLIWLDWRISVNRIRTIVHNPRRLIPWVLVVGWFAISLQGRAVFGARAARLSASAPALEQLGTLARALAPGLLMLALGLNLWRGGDRAPAAFSSAADARFIIGAVMTPRLVLCWLCLRATRRLLLMAGFYLVLFGFIYGRVVGLSTAQAVAGALAVALFSGLMFGTRLAGFTVGRRVGLDMGVAAGVPLTVFGALSLAVGTSIITGIPALADGITGTVAAIPPGSWVVAAFRPDVVALGMLGTVTVAITALGAWLGDDCYPELWTASTRVFAVRRLMGSGGGLLAYRRARRAFRGESPDSGHGTVTSHSGARVPGGLWAVAWKEWLTLRRAPGGLALQLLILGGATVAGVLVHYLTRHARHSSGAFLATELAGITLMLTGFASVRMAADLRNPLWWLSASTLRARLAAWTLFRATRFAVPVAVFLVAYLVALQSEPLLLAAIALTVLLVAWFVQVIGIAAYSIFPAAADRRLTQLVRMFALYLGLVPIAVAAVPGAVLHNPLVALTGAALALAVEAAALVVFAAWRIQDNGIAFAREEAQ